MLEKYLEEKQQRFDALSEDEKGKRIESAEVEAYEIDKRLDLFVSPEKVIPGLNVSDGVACFSKIEKKYKNKPIEKIEMDRTGMVGADFDTQFSGNVTSRLHVDAEESDGQLFKKLKELFRDIPIVDLGAGENTTCYEWASLLKAKGYVAVEPHNWRELMDNILERPLDLKEWLGSDFPELYDKNTKDVPFSVVAEDALTFLRRIPDKSVGIFSFGTDDEVMFAGVKDEKERARVKQYIADVREEIRRVTHPASAILTHNSILTDACLAFGNNKNINGFDVEYQKHPNTRSFCVVRRERPKSDNI